jgi:hypothetical protein
MLIRIRYNFAFIINNIVNIVADTCTCYVGIIFNVMFNEYFQNIKCIPICAIAQVVKDSILNETT